MTAPASDAPTDHARRLAVLFDLCRSGRMDEAEAPYLALAAVPPEDVAGLMAMAEAARLLARPTETVAWLETAVRTANAPPSPAPGRMDEAQAALALALVAAGRLDEGEAVAQEVLGRVRPQDGGEGVAALQARRAMALAHLRGGRLAEAAAACGEVPRTPGVMPLPTAGLASAQQAWAELSGTLALVRMLEGRLDDADALFRQALATPSAPPELMGNHAALLARLGRNDEALDLAEKAVTRRPRLTGTLHLIGTLHHRAGRLETAIAAFHRVLSVDPKHLDARLLLADSLRVAGHWEEATAVCHEGLARLPYRDDGRRAGLLANLGAALQTGGDAVGAMGAYREALRLAPDLPEVHNNLARLHKDAGDPDAAIEQLAQAMASQPASLPLRLNLLALLIQAGRSAEANATAFAIARSAPEDAGLCLRVATLFLQGGWRLRSLPYVRKAIRLAPDAPGHWIAFGDALRDLALPAGTPPTAGLRDDLLAALGRPEVEGTALTRAIAAVLMAPASAPLARLAALPPDGGGAGTGNAPDADGRAMLEDGSLASLAGDTLLLAHLRGAPVCDPTLEHALTRLRRTLLLALTGPGLPERPAWTVLGAALAEQCFLNEYAFAEGDDETQMLEAVLRATGSMLDRGEPPSATMVALIAAYRPLHGWDRAAALPSLDWPEDIRRLIGRQVEEPAEEARIATALPALTPIRNSVSIGVRAQYEENPYPRWLNTGLLPEPVPLPRFLHALFPHATLPAFSAWETPSWEAPEVLVAGCGTGREAVWTAAILKNARVLAVDLSRRSLAYAVRQSRRMGLGIEFAQADLLELGRLDRRFDVIHSVGVLHHMEDPLAGLRVLRGLLRPHGVMEIGLYSAAARRPVTAARRFILERGHTTTTADIRRLRQDILALPDDHPARIVARSPDFYGTSSCRDLLLHHHELHATLPWLAGALDTLGLEFLGFRLADPVVGALYRKRFPEDPAMTSLDRWDRLEKEQPTIFGGMYQAWVKG